MPIGIRVLLWVLSCGAFSAGIAVWLSFFPPAFYRRRILAGTSRETD